MSSKAISLGVKMTQLANLDKATSKLVFKSLPYSAPNNRLFPPPSPFGSSFSSPLFSLRAFPTPARSSPSPRPPSPYTLLPSPPPTLLHTTSSDPSDPLLATPADLRARKLQLKRYRKPYSMDLTILVGKKKVHKSAVVRDRCKRRLRETIRLVVERGAREDGEEAIAFEEGMEGPGKWLVPGFSYVASVPSLEIYRHPLPSLVETVRKALLKLKNHAETQLVNSELARISPPPPMDYEALELEVDNTETEGTSKPEKALEERA